MARMPRARAARIRAALGWGPCYCGRRVEGGQASSRTVPPSLHLVLELFDLSQLPVGDELRRAAEHRPGMQGDAQTPAEQRPLHPPNAVGERHPIDDE